MDKKQKKKLKRVAKKKKEKAASHATQTKLKKQINMFDRLPSECSACQKKFPKTREAHMSWQVVVYNERQLVRLFCPECQEKAARIVGDKSELNS